MPLQIHNTINSAPLRNFVCSGVIVIHKHMYFLSCDLHSKNIFICHNYYQGLSNSFSNDLSDLDFNLPIIKLCTRKPLARRREALAQGVGQWDLSAPDCTYRGKEFIGAYRFCPLCLSVVNFHLRYNF